MESHADNNPLHPFELHPYGAFHLFGLDISLNKAVIMMWVIITLIGVASMIGLMIYSKIMTRRIAEQR